MKQKSRIKATKASRENKFQLAQALRTSNAKVPKIIKLIDPSLDLTELQCQQLMTENNQCCSKQNCLYNAHVSDFGLDIKLFQEEINQRRKALSKMTKTELDEFIFQAFKDAITNVSERGGKSYFECDWKTPGGEIICRKSWCKLNNIPMNRVERCAKRLKEFPDAKGPGHRPFTEKQLHPYNHHEVEMIITQNLNDSGI